MPTQRRLKQRIRDHAAATGMNYTQARADLLAQDADASGDRHPMTLSFEPLTYLGRAAQAATVGKRGGNATNSTVERIALIYWVEDADPRNGGHAAGTVSVKHVRGDGTRPDTFHEFASVAFSHLADAVRWTADRFDLDPPPELPDLPAPNPERPASVDAVVSGLEAFGYAAYESDNRPGTVLVTSADGLGLVLELDRDGVFDVAVADGQKGEPQVLRPLEPHLLDVVKRVASGGTPVQNVEAAIAAVRSPATKVVYDDRVESWVEFTVRPATPISSDTLERAIDRMFGLPDGWSSESFGDDGTARCAALVLHDIEDDPAGWDLAARSGIDGEWAVTSVEPTLHGQMLFRPVVDALTADGIDAEANGEMDFEVLEVEHATRPFVLAPDIDNGNLMLYRVAPEPAEDTNGAWWWYRGGHHREILDVIDVPGVRPSVGHVLHVVRDELARDAG